MSLNKSSLDPEETTFRPITLKLILKTNVLKTATLWGVSRVGEGHIKFKGTIMKLMSDLSTEMTEARGEQHNNILKC